MSWIEGFTLIMRSNFTAIRTKFEDPERMLHQLICDMEEELDRVRRSVAAAIADEIQLAKEVDRVRQEMQQWEARASSGLKRGDEALARQALEQKMLSQERLATLEKSHETQKTQTAKLQAAYRDLEEKIRQARQKRTLLLARLASAESTQAIHNALDRATGKSAFAEFSRLEQKVDRAEALTDAYDRLEGRDPARDELANKFEVDERKSRLEEEMALLKARLNDPLSAE